MHATERLELHRTAKVKGSIRAARGAHRRRCRLRRRVPDDAKDSPVKAELPKPEEKRAPLGITPPRPAAAAAEAPETKPVN